MDTLLPGKILLIEDDVFYHKAWRHHLTDDQLKIAASFAEFKTMAATLDWDSFSAIISDFYLEEGRTACDVIHWLQQAGITRKVYLSSEIEPDERLEYRAFAGILSKSPKKAIEEVGRLLKS